MDAQTVICNAIARRHYLQFQCGGETCVVEPHQLGLDPEGAVVLRAYALPDPSAPPDGAEPWQGYSVSDLGLLMESSLPFGGPRSGYQRAPNEHLRSALCEL